MSSGLAIRLLGSFQVTLDGRPLTAFPTDKARALLAYLAVEADRPHRREGLAALFWPERPAAQSRNNLRQTLFRLRQALADGSGPFPVLLSSHQAIQLDPAADLWLDVAELNRLLERCLSHHPQGGTLCQACRQRLAEAAALYRGEFLAGFTLPDSHPFEWWLLEEQERYHRRALNVLRLLAADRKRAGDFAGAALWARKKIGLEPWRESAHRQAMRALALNGQREAALAQYERCRHILAEELGVAPSARTQQLYRQIRDGDLPGSGMPSTRSHTPTLSESALQAKRPPPPFTGREQQLAALQAHLDRALAGQGGVAFVCGEAGGGKTTLAVEFANRALAAHRDLLVAVGSCDARLGLGDPYQPFREALRLLGGQGASGHWKRAPICRALCYRPAIRCQATRPGPLIWAWPRRPCSSK
jgi:DNA-binding SARP family transcriptional activator